MTDWQQATGIAQRTIIQAGARDIAVDNFPLPAANGWDGSNRRVELKHQGGDCMVLEPSKTAWLRTIVVVLVLSLANITMVLFMLVQGFDRSIGWGERAILIVGPLLFFALLFVGLLVPGSMRRWHRFDRANGLLTISRRPFWFFWGPLQMVRSHPLEDLAGVQVIYCGIQDETLEFGEPGTPGSVVYRQYHSYQLNIVRDDKSEPRLNVASHADGQWMREAGRRLADFLNVPLIEQPESMAIAETRCRVDSSDAV